MDVKLHPQPYQIRQCGKRLARIPALPAILDNPINRYGDSSDTQALVNADDGPFDFYLQNDRPTGAGARIRNPGMCQNRFVSPESPPGIPQPLTWAKFTTGRVCWEDGRLRGEGKEEGRRRNNLSFLKPAESLESPVFGEHPPRSLRPCQLRLEPRVPVMQVGRRSRGPFWKNHLLLLILAAMCLTTSSGCLSLFGKTTTVVRDDAEIENRLDGLEARVRCLEQALQPPAGHTSSGYQPPPLAPQNALGEQLPR